MSQVDALKMVEHVRTRLVDLALSENHFRDRYISDAARKVWAGPGDEGGLVSELWVEGAYSGQLTVDTLDTLLAQGLLPENLHRHLSDNPHEVFPANRRLFTHQSEAVRAAATGDEERPALVISAGTGLGKTEAFLLPMLSDLWSAPDRRPGGGMRCLLLYPMNALVTDQVDRVYKWLQGQGTFRVFHFTSETPEDKRKADKQEEEDWDACRARTRQEARGREMRDGRTVEGTLFAPVPDIVITNYSMLEYMLCRPQDQCFFGPDLRCIILDEAHLYTGTLAGEIKMLLRRVRERCGVRASDVLHIATSATLGGNEEQLRDFTARLFSTERSATMVISGRHDCHKFEGEVAPPSVDVDVDRLAAFADADYATLDAGGELVTNDSTMVAALAEVSALLVSGHFVQLAEADSPSTPAQFLFRALQASPLVRNLADILYKESGNVISLEALTRRLFKRSDVPAREATITLLRLTASARRRSGDLPIVPHRLHFLVRAPEGLSVCLNPQCSGPQELRLDKVGCLQPYGELCRYCEHRLLPLHRCDNCGEFALAAYRDMESGALRPVFREPLGQSASTAYFLLHPGPQEQLSATVVDTATAEEIGRGDGIMLWEAQREHPDGPQHCPTCASMWSLGEDDERAVCRPLSEGRQFALSVIAETVLHDLPVYPNDTRHWKPGEGRRLLCFSDSRSSAARLGPLLTIQHETQVVRAAMARLADELVPEETADYARREVQRLDGELRATQNPGIRTLLQRQLDKAHRVLRDAEAGTPFIDFARLLCDRAEMAQLIERALAEGHQKDYDQRDWKANRDAVCKHAEALVGRELWRPRKKEALLESTGLFEVVYPGVADIELPPQLEPHLSRNLRSTLRPAWPCVVALMLDSVRAAGCIDWKSERPELKWMDESPLQGRWLTRERNGWNASPFVGATMRQSRRWFVAKVLGSAGCTEADAERLSVVALGALFDHLVEQARNGTLHWLRFEPAHQVNETTASPALQILMEDLSVRKPSRLFRCETTGTLWVHTALGWIPEKGCVGRVNEMDQAALDEDSRWGRARRELRESPIFQMGLWAEEHSAQLNPRENKRLQELFKLGARNVLSATTTMELGIDIGGLNGVLLSNVPPGPANHRQRAGRAGRRSDGSAVVVTYVRDTNYERQAFLRFDGFLRRPLRVPTVVVNRLPIIRRHLHAMLLSEFLRPHQGDHSGAMHAFGMMGHFCGEQAPDYWRKGSKPTWPASQPGLAAGFEKYLREHETDAHLRQRVIQMTEGTALHDLHNDARWTAFVADAQRSFHDAVEEWRRQLADLRDAWHEIPGNPQTNVSRERSKAASIWYMTDALCGSTVIAWLADKGFLPRYGFPINLQSLSVRSTSNERGASRAEERYRLERNSLLALREYVPDAQVLAGNRLITSRGLRKDWTDANINQALGLSYHALTCPDGHVYVRQNQNQTCPVCQAPPTERDLLVMPRFGFTTASWDSTPFGTRLERVGEPDYLPLAFVATAQDEDHPDFLEVPGLNVWYREEAEMLVRNRGKSGHGFAICHRCGYATSEEHQGNGRVRLPDGFALHARIFSTDRRDRCWNREEEAPVLRNRVLAARDKTNLLLVRWPNIAREEALYTLGRALVLAGAALLELDERELGLEPRVRLQDGRTGLALYDTAAGGAGHCRELLSKGHDWFGRAWKVLYVNDEHDARCEQACLECILDFSSQRQAHLLNRIAALTLLSDVGIHG